MQHMQGGQQQLLGGNGHYPFILLNGSGLSDPFLPLCGPEASWTPSSWEEDYFASASHLAVWMLELHLCICVLAISLVYRDKLGLSGLHNKCVYTQSHLVTPKSGFLQFRESNDLESD